MKRILALALKFTFLLAVTACGHTQQETTSTGEVVPYIQEPGITVQGWYPFGGQGYTSELLGDPVISALNRDEKHDWY